MRLVYLAIGWAIGIVAAATYDFLIPLVWLIAMGLTIALAGMGWYTGLRWLLLGCVAITIGGYRYQFVPQTSDLAQYNRVGAATIEGVIIDEPDVRDDRIQIRVRATTINLGIEPQATDGRILVNAPRTADVRYGDIVRVTGRLNAPAVYDTFSYADFLAREGVFTVMDNAVVEVVGQGAGNPIIAALLNAKSHLQAKIAQNLPDPEAALLTGILLGNERGIDPKLGEAFNRVGAAHIIAISGFNMAIIAGIIMGSLGRIFSRQWIAVTLGIIALGLYTLLVGANAAVIRASVMSSLLVIGPLFKRKTYVPASLAFVAIMMSVLQPLVLWDISFQLSFFAVLGLALFTAPLTRYFDALLFGLFPDGLARFVGAILNEPLVVSIAALITTLPLTILYFQRLSIVSLLVNIFVVPVQAYVLLFGGVALLLSFVFPPVAQILFWVDYVLLAWSIGIVRWFAAIPFADVSLSVGGFWVLSFFVALIGGAIMSAVRPPWARRLAAIIRQRSVLTALIVTGFGIVILMGMIGRSRPDGMLHVWWLDVGHSHAVLVQSPGGSQMLVDGGRFPSRLLTTLGDRLPFYDRTLEVLVITHPDEFDTGALPAVLERYDAQVVLVNGQPNLSESYALLESAIASSDVITVRAGYSIELDDGTLIEVLHPTTAPSLNDNQSDNALVLRITYGEVSFLLTSDLSRSGQADLLSDGQWPLATVMGLPQHATQRSLDEGFLQAVQPQAAVLQNDAANRRGDPDPDTLALLGDTPLYRTDEGGTLHFWTDGEMLWLKPEG